MLTPITGGRPLPIRRAVAPYNRAEASPGGSHDNPGKGSNGPYDGRGLVADPKKDPLKKALEDAEAKKEERSEQSKD